MTAFYHALGFFEDDIGYLYMAFCRLVKSRCYDLGLNAACHVGYLFGTLVYEQYYHIYLGVVFRYGIGYIF